MEVGGEIRYGRSDAVPSLLDLPPAGIASVVLVIERGDPSAADPVGAAARYLRTGTDLVVVGDGIDDEAAEGVASDLAAAPPSESPHEVVRTSARLGRAAALNAGMRRARGAIVIVLDPSAEVTGDVVSPLVDALADPTVAIAGAFGLVSNDLRHFQEVTPEVGSSGSGVEAVAIQGGPMAFRRADAAARGPLDEAFRSSGYLDTWWSLVLRDEGEGGIPRRAVVVSGLPIERRERPPSAAARSSERDRKNKRDFYRLLDRFRTRLDLGVPGGG